MSGLDDDTLTLTVYLTDVAGNQGVNATDTVVKDTTAPSGYSVNIDQAEINNGNKTALSFTFASAEMGATYNYSIEDTNPGTAAVTGTGTIGTATDQISNVDVSGLDNDTLTLTLHLTDTAVNQGVNATDTVVKDTVAPTLSSITPADETTNVAIDTNITIKFNESLDTSVTTGWTVGCSTGSFNFTNFNAEISYSTTTNANDTVTINPNTNLSNSTTYGNITISGLKDLVGNTVSYNNNTYNIGTEAAIEPSVTVVTVIHDLEPFNGTYTFDSVINGRASYFKDSGEDARILWSGTRWELIANYNYIDTGNGCGSDRYQTGYNNTNSELPPPNEIWENDDSWAVTILY